MSAVFDGEELRPIRDGRLRQLRAVPGDEARQGQGLRVHQLELRRTDRHDAAGRQLAGQVAESADESEGRLRGVRLRTATRSGRPGTERDGHQLSTRTKGHQHQVASCHTSKSTLPLGLLFLLLSIHVHLVI